MPPAADLGSALAGALPAISLIALASAYALRVVHLSTAGRPVPLRRQVSFLAGVVVIAVALVSPLSGLADELLTFHMLQHLLLIFVTAPLWLAGMPEWLLRRLVMRWPVDRIGRFLTRPVVAFGVASVIISFWHLPVGYQAALNNEPVHVVQHVSFLVAAVLSWWPVFGRLREWPRLPPPLRCVYLFVWTVPGNIVGSFVTFAEPGLYPHYNPAPRIFGIGLEMDQQIAGLMMSVLTSFVYLLILTAVFFRWAAGEDAKEARRRPQPAAPARDPVARFDSSGSSAG